VRRQEQAFGVPIAAILMLCAAFVLYKRNIQKKTGKMTEPVAAQNAQPELVQNESFLGTSFTTVRFST
jgi:hypothetical protein